MKPEQYYNSQRERKGNHKSTKKWCKGVQGREHEYEVVLPPNVPGWKKEMCQPAKSWAIEFGWLVFCDHAIVCKKCGKHNGQPEVCPTSGTVVHTRYIKDSSS